jgi:ABC-type antimicrobial peptide transport system permease subunit
MNKKIQISILSIFVAAALVGSVLTIGENMAFAGGDNNNGDKKKKKSNEAVQGIGQSTETLQGSSCGSGNDTTASCNNVALSFNLNDGNNALGQQ